MHHILSFNLKNCTCCATVCHYIIYYVGRLVGDVLLCTGFLSYSGPFNQEFRTHLNDTWSKELGKRSIPYTTNLNLTAMLADNATVCITNNYLC